MHDFAYLAQRRSQEFSCEPSFGGAPPWLRSTTTFRRQLKTFLFQSACGHRENRQTIVLSNVIHQRVIEKNKQKTIYNKHQNTTDVQDYQAVTCV